MKRRVVVIFFLFLLASCSRRPADGPFGLWKSMTRNDINRCCQIVRTAMLPNSNASVLRLAMVPEPDPLFDQYFAHFSQRTGVFAINASSPGMSLEDGEAAYQKLVSQMTAKYGPPSRVLENGDVIWDSPPSSMGLLRLTISKGDHEGLRRVGIFYLFNNNRIYE